MNHIPNKITLDKDKSYIENEVSYEIRMINSLQSPNPSYQFMYQFKTLEEAKAFMGIEKDNYENGRSMFGPQYYKIFKVIKKTTWIEEN